MTGYWQRTGNHEPIVEPPAAIDIASVRYLEHCNAHLGQCHARMSTCVHACIEMRMREQHYNASLCVFCIEANKIPRQFLI